MSTAVEMSLMATPKWLPKVLPLPYLVNQVAISDDAKRVVACYYYYPYLGTTVKDTHGAFCTFCCDSAGNRLWADQYFGCQGVFAVAISGDGKVAASGGLLTDTPSFQGLLRAYDAGTGEVILNYTGIIGAVAAAPAAPGPPDTGRRQRVSCVALSNDGAVLAAAADKIYVFVRKADGKYPDRPTKIITFPDAFNQNNLAQAVAVHPDGKWLAACDKTGNVCMATIKDGEVQEPIYRWSAPKVPIDRKKPGGPTGFIVFLSVAISAKGNFFVVGGGDFVYLFTFEGMRQGEAPTVYDTFAPELSTPPAPVVALGAAPPPPPTSAPQNVRWVAASDDGSCVVTAVNRFEGSEKTGSIIRLDGRLNPAWEKRLPRNPNSASVDAAAKYVTACDGYPIGTPGSFYLFDGGSGEKMWEYPTTNMNWPMFISKDGTGIAAGGDDGLLYYFDPNQPSPMAND